MSARLPRRLSVSRCQFGSVMSVSSLLPLDPAAPVQDLNDAVTGRIKHSANVWPIVFDRFLRAN